MSDNILKATIDVSAPGAAQAFKTISDGARNTDAAFKTLNPSVSKLGSTLNALKFNLLDLKADLLNTNDISRVRELNGQIKQLENEIIKVGTASESGLGKIGTGASHALSSVRQLAYILPGIGVAGIFDAAFHGLEKLGELIAGVGNKFNLAAVDAEVFKAANKAVGDDVARLQALVSVAKDVSLSTLERKNAITELQRLYPDYLRNISLENINSAAASAAIDNLTKSIVNKAIAQIYSQKVAEETLKLSDKQEKVNELLAKQGERLKEIETRRATEPAYAIKQLIGQYEIEQGVLRQTTLEMNDQQDVVNKLTGRLKDATIAELDFVKTAKEKKPDTWDQYEANLNAVILRMRQLEKEFGNLDQIGKKERIKITSAIDFDAIANDLPDEPIKNISKNIQQLVKNLTESNPILIRARTKIELTVEQKQLEAQMKEINGIITSGFQNTFESIGQGLVSGNIGKSILTAIGSLLENIGKALIKFGIIKLGLDQILKGGIAIPGGFAIALGILAVATGALIKSLKGFAGGGDVFGNTPIIVGERGPEIFVPNTGGRIIPNHQIQGSGHGISGGNVQVQGQFVIKGNDLIAVIAKSTQSQNRLT